MPQVDPVRHRSKRTSTVVIAVGVACVVVAVIVVAVVMWASKPKETKTATEGVLKNVMRQEFRGQRDAAITSLKEQLTKARTDEEKLALYVTLGSVYENKSDNAAALEAYRKAAAIKEGYGTNSAIARTAEATGDKDLALDYYERNRKLIKSGKTPERNGELDDVEKAIVRLGGTL